jgi:signal transduction histidine kinase
LLSLGELAQDVTNQFRQQANQQNIKLQTQIPSSLPMVTGDIALLDRVLQNVIGNSLKFCDSGDTILVSAGHLEGRVWVEIKDSGAGISEEDLPHIFNRFHKGKSRRAIVKSILELHGATYQIFSQEGQGTTFHFDLPVARTT